MCITMDINGQWSGLTYQLLDYSLDTLIYTSHYTCTIILNNEPQFVMQESNFMQFQNPQTSQGIVQQVAGEYDNCCRMVHSEILFCNINQLHSVRPDMRHCLLFT